MRVASGGYYSSPWPGEDGNPERHQVPRTGSGLNLRDGEQLTCVTRRVMLGTMTVLREPGEVYLLTHSALRRRLFRAPTTSCVERIDPHTLKTTRKSPRLAAGPMWPGGMAVHRNGDLYVVYGRYVHRLNPDCELKASYKLPVNQPYNSFVILDNGILATKNLSDSRVARLSFIDPESLRPVCEDIECPEPSIARLSSTGNTLYVVGTRSIFRYGWNESSGTPEFDPSWRHDYIGTTSQTYAWDVVLDGRNAWFMDNGKHNYVISIIGAGMNPTSNRLIRVSMTDADDHDAIEISGIDGGSITNPPLYDLQRNIIVAFDSANRYLRAWRYDTGAQTFDPLWEKPDFGTSSHLILLPDTGELVVNDYRRRGEEVVVLRIETGQEIARVRTGWITQGVVFPSMGWNRDFYWTTLGRLARVFIE